MQALNNSPGDFQLFLFSLLLTLYTPGTARKSRFYLFGLHASPIGGKKDLDMMSSERSGTDKKSSDVQSVSETIPLMNSKLLLF